MILFPIITAEREPGLVGILSFYKNFEIRFLPTFGSHQTHSGHVGTIINKVNIPI
jgi:hypothetical protein